MWGPHKPHAGDTDEWYTPPSIFEALGTHFALDPASPLDGPVPWVPAERFLTARDDGLHAPWQGRIWLNPPYGPHTVEWIERLAVHGDGIALLFARTDTRWFHEHVARADAMCFIAGRLHFHDRTGKRFKWNAGAPSMLVAYGAECAAVLGSCGLGLVVEPPLTPDVEISEIA